MRQHDLTSLLNDVPRETRVSLETYVEMLITANQRQNLISKASEADVWERHIYDAAQLAPFVRSTDANLVDIGTGPGLPGVVLAIMLDLEVTLVEPRPLRTAFLRDVATRLDLGSRVTIVEGKADSLRHGFDVITGRAVAPVAKFLELSHHLSTEKTRWVLPKGRRAAIELEEARRVWQIDCEIVPSKSGGDGQILVVDRAKRRRRG